MSLGSRIAAIVAVGYSSVMGASAASLSVMFTTSPDVPLLFSGGSDHGKWPAGTSVPYWRDIGPRPPSEKPRRAAMSMWRPEAHTDGAVRWARIHIALHLNSRILSGGAEVHGTSVRPIAVLATWKSG